MSDVIIEEYISFPLPPGWRRELSLAAKRKGILGRDFCQAAIRKALDEAAADEQSDAEPRAA